MSIFSTVYWYVYWNHSNGQIWNILYLIGHTCELHLQGSQTFSLPSCNWTKKWLLNETIMPHGQSADKCLHEEAITRKKSAFQTCFITAVYLSSILKSLLILAIWLALSGGSVMYNESPLYPFPKLIHVKILSLFMHHEKLPKFFHDHAKIKVITFHNFTD